MTILYIGPKMNDPKNGGDRIEYRNQLLLELITREGVTYFSPDFCYDSFIAKLRMTIGLTKAKKKELKELVAVSKFDIIFVSQSTYGGYVSYLKSICKIPLVTFFHNAEINYFIASHDNDKKKLNGLHYIAKVIWCEFLSNRKSDYIITLNERDSCVLKKCYGRGADFILPTTFEDNVDEEKARSVVPDIDCLFVGSNFFANTQGLQWFIDNVLPSVNGELYIIGNRMEDYKFVNINKKIHIKGFVEDISQYYNRAKVVISPIFCGSGMKTKTAEALMYGKIIVGTSEAFEGYIINPECMKLCNTANEFITSVNEVIGSNQVFFNKTARQHFKEYYSNKSLIKPLKDYLEGLVSKSHEKRLS